MNSFAALSISKDVFGWWKRLESDRKTLHKLGPKICWTAKKDEFKIGEIYLGIEDIFYMVKILLPDQIYKDEFMNDSYE